MTKFRPAVIAACAALLGLPSAAAAAAPPERYVSVASSVSSGPSACNQLGVLKIGKSTAKNVLVLIPGYLGGSGDFRVIGRRLATSFKNLQVWGIDRRSQCLEDTSGFSSGDPVAALDHYFMQLNDKTFTAPKEGDPGVEAARSWGLTTTLKDIRSVVLEAKKLKGKVVLGGHSLGGMLASEYATWDFSGTPGYKDVSGLVLIDGAAREAFGAAPSTPEATTQIASLNTGMPFSKVPPNALDGTSYYTGVFPEMAALYAIKAAKSNFALQGLLNNVGFGDFTRPTSDGLLNNEAGLGYAFDRDTSPENFQLFHMNMGGLRPGSSPGAWADGGLTDLKDVKTLFGTEPGNAVEWYFPKRLSIEAGAATTLTKTAVTDFLDLRTWHLADVNVPLYGFETGLTCSSRPTITPGDASTVTALNAWVAANKTTKCSVLQGVKSLADNSKITKATLVSDHDQEHLDPLVARPGSNKFQSTLTTFLRSLKIS